MTLSELNDDTRGQYEISAEVAGVVVTEVEPNSAAAERGIKAAR